MTDEKRYGTENKYVEFIEDGEKYLIYNKIYKEYVGEIRKERMGTWMHWHLFLYPNCGCTNGCLKEISPFITTLYSKDRKKIKTKQVIE